MAVGARADEVEVPGHVPVVSIARSRLVGRLAATATVPTAICLPLRDPDGLAALIKRQHDPTDPQYGHYLTPDEFTARFAPTEADYAATREFAEARGFRVTHAHACRMFLHVEAEAGTVEQALGVHLVRYLRSDGHAFFAPDAEPRVPAALAGRVSGFAGLHTANSWHKHATRSARLVRPMADAAALPEGISPDGIRKAYELPADVLGDGQIVGLLLLDDFASADVATYAKMFGIKLPTVTKVVGPKASAVPGGDADEATLDVEMQIALAPHVTKVMAYVAENSDAGILDGLDHMASDNLAKSMSTSWGDFEADVNSSFLKAEANVFQRMAAQGQSFFSAAGDNGARDDEKHLSVDDPGTQPFVTSVGGTSLALNADGTYAGETTWNRGTVKAGAGGGGISQVWPIPDFQKGLVDQSTKGSLTMRNVPDISLESDPEVGYAVFISGTWQVYGGTSAAAPLWAAFGGLVNQQRAAHGHSTIGFFNQPLYDLARTDRYAADFHDIADGSTNLFYPAIKSFDDATGLGTMRGANLLADLAGVPAAPVALPAALPPTPTPTPTPSAGSVQHGGCEAMRHEQVRATGSPADAPGAVADLLPLLVFSAWLALRRQRA